MSSSNLRGSLSSLAASTFSSLSLPDYRRVYFGNMAFQFSVWAQRATFSWLLTIIGNSPAWNGVGAAAYGVAMIFMSPIGGILADSWERRKAMLMTQLMAVIVNASIALLYALGWLEIWHLLVASALMGVSFTMNMPARQSLMAEMVPRRLMHNATALHTASMNLNRITGPAAAGALMAAIGALPVMLINLVANSWTVWQLTQVRYRPTRAPKPFRLDLDGLLGGFRYCWQQRDLLRVLAIVSVANFFGLAYVDLLAPLARDKLGLGPDGFGLMMATMGGGALAGALLLAPLKAVPRKELLLSLAATTLGLLLVGLGQVADLVAATTALALIGASSAAITAFGLAAIQERISDEVSGRVFGVYMLTMGLMPVGTLPAGLLAARIGTGPAISVWGLLCAVISATLLVVGQAGARRLTQPAATSTAPGA